MYIWRRASDVEKAYILKTERHRMLIQLPIIIFVAFMASLLILFFISETHNTKRDNLIRQDLGYDPNNPPVDVFSDIDPALVDDVVDLWLSYSGVDSSDSETADTSDTYNTVHGPTKEEIQSEIAAAQQRADEELGDGYRIEMFTATCVLLVFIIAVIIFFYLKYKKDSQRYYLIANASCVEKERNVRRNRFYITVMLDDKSTINDIPVNSTLYSNISYSTPLVVSKWSDSSATVPEYMDAYGARLFLESELA